MTDEQEVIASVPWRCDTCGVDGVLRLGVAPDVLGLFARLKQMHREASPKCEGVPADLAQIDVPEGAVVNDPRARPVRLRTKPGATMGLIAALGMVAANAAYVIEPGRDMPPLPPLTPPSLPGSYWDDRRPRGLPRRAARSANTHVAHIIAQEFAARRREKADAKRKRKASLRSHGGVQGGTT